MEVEVVFPRICGAFYEAYIQDIDVTKGNALLTFPSDWKSAAWVELSQIRFIQDVAAMIPMSSQTGKKVEALLPHHDNEPAGWWTGNLLKSKGDLHVVEFQSGSEKYQDIVENDKLRPPNTNVSLSKVTLYTKEFAVTEELSDYCQRRGVHECFRSKINAICVSYDSSKNVLVVLAGSETSLNKAELLSDMHFRDLLTQKSLLGVNDMMGQRPHSYRSIDPRRKEIRFHIPEDLVGMAIGREGANVNEARRIPGVTSVEFDDYSSMFFVKGEDEEALLKAKERLEFGREIMLVPQNLAGKMIGKNGNVIQEILDKSKVHNVRIVGGDEARDRGIKFPNQIQFDFIGRKADIDNAKMMMEYHLDHLKKVERILLSRKEQGIPSSSSAGPTYFPPPVNASRAFRRGSGRGGRGGGTGTRGRRQRDQFVDGLEAQGREEEGKGILSSPPNLQGATSNAFPIQPDDPYRSDDDSDSNEEEYKEARREVVSEEEKSAPEEDEQGPDRRRQHLSRVRVGGGVGSGGRGGVGSGGRGGASGGKGGGSGGRGGRRGGKGRRDGWGYGRNRPAYQNYRRLGVDDQGPSNEGSSGRGGGVPLWEGRGAGRQDGRGGGGDRGRENGRGGAGERGREDGRGGAGERGNEDGRGGAGDRGREDGRGGAGERGNEDGRRGAGERGREDGRGGAVERGNEDGRGGAGEKGREDGKGGAGERGEDGRGGMGDMGRGDGRGEGGHGDGWQEKDSRASVEAGRSMGGPRIQNQKRGRQRSTQGYRSTGRPRANEGRPLHQQQPSSSTVNGTGGGATAMPLN